MAKRRKYKRLPNGFGNISYLGKGRRNPYAVYPPCTETDDLGRYVRPKAICYVPDYYTGFAVLTAYNAGNYVPGMELDIIQDNAKSLMEGLLADKAVRDASLDLILTTYNSKVAAGKRMVKGKTFDEVYREWYAWKYEAPSGKTFSESTKAVVRSTYAHLSEISNIPIADLTVDDLQGAVDRTESVNYKKNEVVIIKQVYKYALMKEYIDKDQSMFVKCGMTAVHEEGSPFTDQEIRLLWENEKDDTIALVLMMIYSGFRIGELSGLEVNLDDLYFRGGIKTENGRDRIVPIHSAIVHIVRNRMEKYGCINNVTKEGLRYRIVRHLEGLGIKGKTPHDTRHTFSALLEAAGVTDSDRKRLLGHALTDVTSGVYGHRTVEQLRESIEKVIVYK